jgi:hypothetical protein
LKSGCFSVEIVIVRDCCAFERRTTGGTILGEYPMVPRVGTSVD